MTDQRSLLQLISSTYGSVTSANGYVEGHTKQLLATEEKVNPNPLDEHHALARARALSAQGHHVNGTGVPVFDDGAPAHSARGSKC